MNSREIFTGRSNDYFRNVEVVSFSNPFTMDLDIFIGNMRRKNKRIVESLSAIFRSPSSIQRSR